MPLPTDRPAAWYAVMSGAKVLVKQMSEQEAQEHQAEGWEMKAFATRQQARAAAMTWEGRLSDAFG